MKVQNMTSSKGNKVANQFIIREDEDPISGNAIEYVYIYNPNWTISGADEDFNKNGIAEFQIVPDIFNE